MADGVDSASSAVNWLRIACQKREAERDRCFNIVYSAMLLAENAEVLEALKSVAFEIVDPK